MSGTADAARRDLARIVGDDAVQVPVADRSLVRDMTETRGLSGDALGAVFPGSTDEVAAVVRWCAKVGVPFVPRGGGTGYAGGAMPDAGSLVIAPGRMTRVREAVPQAWRMTVEAGLTTRRLHAAAAGEGLWFAPNPGAAEQSQLGGNIATNAGGPRSFRHGTVRSFLTGVELVLASGEVLVAGGAARKNVEALDLTGLACGSEGTLGVITAAWLRLLPRPEVILPAIALYPDRRAGVAALEAAMACGCVPTALEFVDDRAFAAAAATYPRHAEPGSFAVITESAGPAAIARAEREIIVDALAAGATAVDAPDSPGEQRALESWRDGVSPAVVAVRGGKVSEDFAVPFDRLGEALDMIERIAAGNGAEVACWGHAGDGNVHASVLVDRSDRPALLRAEAVADAFHAVPRSLGGSLTGEHGIGMVKLETAAAELAPALLDAQRAVVDALDPAGLANPGRKIPPARML
jgi:FAD/FMN-containing dehydrogenase